MSKNIELVMKGYRLTTAEILYHMPDHPELLQTFVWQAFDIAPRFPALNRFLGYWEANIVGRLHSVRFASAGLSAPLEIRYAQGDFALH